MGAYFIYALIVLCVTIVMLYMLYQAPSLQDAKWISTIIGSTLGGLVGFLGGMAVTNKVKEKVGEESTQSELK